MESYHKHSVTLDVCTCSCTQSNHVNIQVVENVIVVIVFYFIRPLAWHARSCFTRLRFEVHIHICQSYMLCLRSKLKFKKIAKIHFKQRIMFSKQFSKNTNEMEKSFFFNLHTDPYLG